MKNNAEALPSFLVYGPSGSGVHTALKAFREFNYQVLAGVSLNSIASYFSIASTDGVPTAISPNLDPQTLSPDDAKAAFEKLKKENPDIKFLYLSTPSEVLVSRYTEAEKKHPFDKTGLRDAVESEQLLYRNLKALSDYHVDTSATTDRELAMKVAKILNIQVKAEPMTVTISSFGFKNGVPLDADLVFDMRFLPNPFYQEELRPFTGKDKAVADYVMSFPEAGEFLSQWQKLIAHVLPLYQREGRTRLHIAVGCTGGQHRSVAMTLALADYLAKSFADFNVRIIHREENHWPEKASKERV